MKISLDLIQDADNAAPVEVLFEGVKTDKGNALLVKLSEPRDEFLIHRAELAWVTSQAWRSE